MTELNPAQRITLIQECSTLLDKHDFDFIDLVLGQYGLPISDVWNGSKTGYVVQMIKDAPDQGLEALHSYMTGQADTSRPGQSPWSSEHLRLFCSHLATERAIVGVVGEAMARYGVEAFVAHTSIEPSKEWQDVIEAGLTECDAMIVFLHPGFIESKWCDQEVGWALGRRRPILPLNYGIHPYGFLAKFQDQPCADKPPHNVALFVMDWLRACLMWRVS